VEDCPFTAGVSMDTPVCAFMAGFFSAVFYHVSGERYNCIEEECRATGADTCQFTAKSASESFLESF
jgi:bacteriochlorophyll 4-vinyl reductase